jgi:hypothetical protein
MVRSISAPRSGTFVSDWLHRVSHIFYFPSADVIESRGYATWKIWIWASPGLALAPFVIRPRDPALKILLAAFVLTWLFYFLVPFDQGHGWGYRYVHPVWAILPIAGGLWFARNEATRSLGATILAAGLLATPVFFWETHETIAGFLARRIDVPSIGRWVVFVNIAPTYAADLVQNLPGHDRVLYLTSRGDQQDARLMAMQFPHGVMVRHDSRGSSWQLP